MLESVEKNIALNQTDNEHRQRKSANLGQDDIADLLPHLQSRAADHATRAEARLTERAEAESRSMTQLLQRQRKRIADAAGAEGLQMELEFDQAEKRQREADRRAWARRLEAIETELETEPQRIADTYTVQATRVDPLGLVYLWPRTG